MREVLQRTHGGQFVFKDDPTWSKPSSTPVAIAVSQPAFQMSRAVKGLRVLLDKDEKEDEYRTFIHRHWREILGPEYKEVQCLPIPVARGGQIDLYAIRHDGFPDLWELKPRADPIFGRYNDCCNYHSDACARAIGQLMEYFDEAEKNARAGSLSYEGRKGIDVIAHRPRGFVVIGRYSKEPEEQRFQRERPAGEQLRRSDGDDVRRSARKGGTIHRFPAIPRAEELEARGAWLNSERALLRK
ncbi:MAG: DUF4263 domain-containing protein [Polyangiaceae bacterium]